MPLHPERLPAQSVRLDQPKRAHRAGRRNGVRGNGPGILFVFPDRLEYLANRCAIFCPDFRPPDLEEEHDAQGRAAVPRLMLDRIVEDEQLAFLPLPRLAALRISAAAQPGQSPG